MSTPKTLDPPATARQPRPARPGPSRRPHRRPWRQALRRDWQLYSLATLPLLFFAVFRYLPMAGNVIAFRRYEPGGSVFGEQWVASTTSGCSSTTPRSGRCSPTP